MSDEQIQYGAIQLIREMLKHTDFRTWYYEQAETPHSDRAIDEIGEKATSLIQKMIDDLEGSNESRAD